MKIIKLKKKFIHAFFFVVLIEKVLKILVVNCVLPACHVSVHFVAVTVCVEVVPSLDISQYLFMLSS